MLDAEKLQGTVGKFSVGNARVVGALAFDQMITLMAMSTSHDFGVSLICMQIRLEFGMAGACVLGRGMGKAFLLLTFTNYWDHFDIAQGHWESFNMHNRWGFPLESSKALKSTCHSVHPMQSYVTAAA
jgi:hypothetical protein